MKALVERDKKTKSIEEKVNDELNAIENHESCKF